MHSWYEDRKETYQGPIPKIEYQTGKDAVAVGTFVATGGLATISKIKKGTDFVEGLVTTVKKSVGVAKFSVKQIDDLILNLKSKAKYVLEGTGEYNKISGHHPLAKKAFEGVKEYDYKKAFSVKTDILEDAWKKINKGIPQNIHANITGQQNKLYSAWKKVNPNKKLGIQDMAEIEIKAMVNAGIPEDIATGWVVKALEDIKVKGVREIKNIPWNGTN